MLPIQAWNPKTFKIQIIALIPISYFLWISGRLEPKFQNSNNHGISNLSFSLDLEPYAPSYLQYPPSVPLPHAHKDEIR
ncbi:hypothetical protein HanRHA438_Chr13g0580601 [Helianthus annuus]|nr:hypothetical protein HanHA300_Chr13g0466691 [Helianthus annuus]KAJ0479439.1 hypothetical protein HanIR_Chr13g0620021 [Helianthus annuus]KAJ0496328.1 hypothetical protein HanHA89_Chr13g0498441 [Helianthus annuus]KAJ0662388.1 hypothetical protein HanLR1_Chr13g0468881 [Helianthus annuus]KAJ0669914.1 hypothetical protein HanOQP8_Chr13g0467961 [Helianthus annuus]